jgi:hypothetical protein
MQTTLSNSPSARAKRSTLAPAVLSAADAFGLFGVSYSNGMALVRAGRFPVECIKIGGAYKFRKSDVAAYLGIDLDALAEIAG